MGCPRARNSSSSSSSSDFFASCSTVLLSNIMHAPHKPPNENVSSQSTIKRDLSVATLWHCCISQPKAFPLLVASLMSPRFRFWSKKYIPIPIPEGCPHKQIGHWPEIVRFCSIGAGNHLLCMERPMFFSAENVTHCIHTSLDIVLSLCYSHLQLKNPQWGQVIPVAHDCCSSTIAQYPAVCRQSLFCTKCPFGIYTWRMVPLPKYEETSYKKLPCTESDYWSSSPSIVLQSLMRKFRSIKT